MTSPIEPIRRAEAARRVRRNQDEAVSDGDEFDARNLPVPQEPPSRAAPPPGARPPAAAVFAAQLLGQDGQKRGLRGGPATLDAARSSYTRTEWSGGADRRTRTGRGTKTEI